MKILRSMIITAMFPFLACAGTGEQGQVNGILEDIAMDLASLFDKFATATNCQEADSIITNTSGTQLCSGGGNSTTVVSNVQCQEDPLTVSFDGKVTTNDCSAGGNSSNGSYNINVQITPAQDQAVINGMDFNISGFSFDFFPMSVMQDASGNLSCSGAVRVDGQPCAVSSDCSNCPL